MPLLDVTIVGEPARRQGLAQRLADAAGAALQARAGGTWVTLHVVEAGDYAESAGAPDGVMPVFVRLIERELPRGDDLDTRVIALAEAVASVCARPRENVHVVLEPAGAGRIAFGGVLVR